MKKYAKKTVWKDNMIVLWEGITLTYRSMCENPRFKMAVKLLLALLKLIFHIVVRKIFDTLFDFDEG